MRISPVSNNYMLQQRNLNKIESIPNVTPPLYQ